MSSFDVSIEKFGGIHTHVVHMELNRVSPLYPGLFITIRYQLDPKTGLFFNNEERVKCYISPLGWDSTGSFNVPTRDLDKRILPGCKVFHFMAYVQVDVGDAKATVKAFDNGIEFTAPRKHGRIGVEGEIDYKGQGWAKNWKVA